jgi:hypothetical protein
MAERTVTFESFINSVRLKGVTPAGLEDGFAIATIARDQTCASCPRRNAVTQADLCDGVENIGAATGFLYQDWQLTRNVYHSASQKCQLVDASITVP